MGCYYCKAVSINSDNTVITCYVKVFTFAFNISLDAFNYIYTPFHRVSRIKGQVFPYPVCTHRRSVNPIDIFKKIFHVNATCSVNIIHN